jgi:hypothetical protein
MKPAENLKSSRSEFAFDMLRELPPSLPSKVIFDISAGAGQMKTIERLGLSWRVLIYIPTPERLVGV